MIRLESLNTESFKKQEIYNFKGFCIFLIPKHFLHSKDLVVFPLSRHVCTFGLMLDQIQAAGAKGGVRSNNFTLLMIHPVPASQSQA